MTDDHDYLNRIRELLSVPSGTGSFKEIVEIDGETVEFRFPQAVGFGWSLADRDYRQQFGTSPDWLRQVHPGRRIAVCRFALEQKTPLPAERPR